MTPVKAKHLMQKLKNEAWEFKVMQQPLIQTHVEGGGGGGSGRGAVE